MHANWIRAAALAAAAVTAGCYQVVNNPPERDDERVAALSARLDAALHRIALLEDRDAIVNLQRIYGYYLDKALFDQLVELFTDDVSLEYSQRGVYLGKQRARQLMTLMPGGEGGLQQGMLQNHIQIGGVVHVADDGASAKGRWRALVMMGDPSGGAAWQEGIYENEYRKEQGTWKISKVHFYLNVNADYEGGWGRAARGLPGVNPDFPPDLPPSEVYQPYPSVYVPPFHYRNPVTGQ